MAIGARLTRLRKKADLTLEEVSKGTGISPQQISKYEKEIITNIPSDKIELLADFYKVSPGYIMGWEETAPPVEPLSPSRTFLMDQLRNASEDDVKKMEQIWKMIKDQDN